MGQLLVSSRGLGKADSLAELLKGEPALADRVTQERDAALTLGIRRQDRRRPRLAVLSHLQHPTVGPGGERMRAVLTDYEVAVD